MVSTFHDHFEKFFQNFGFLPFWLINHQDRTQQGPIGHGQPGYPVFSVFYYFPICLAIW
jgi:hypothetical protein